MLFQRAVCLNLDKRQEDGKKIEELFLQHNFPIERFVVGYGELLKLSEYNEIHSYLPTEKWKNGPSGHSVGGYNSFRAFQSIIRRCKQRVLDSVLLLEDDAWPANDDWLTQLTELEQKIAANNIQWDMLYLGANHAWAPTLEVVPGLLKLFGSLCFHSVIIKSHLFDTILSWEPSEPIDATAAKELHTQYNCFAAWPSIFIQKPGISYLQNMYFDYSQYWQNKGNPCL